MSPATRPRLLQCCQAPGAGALGVWLRLFLLRCEGDGAPSEAAARAALAPLSLEALVDAGVLRVADGGVTSWLQLVADDGGLVLSDPGGVHCDPDHVMALGPSSLEVWALSPARLAGLRIAELGTGSGALALRWARRGAEVLATDVTPRAVTLAAWNVVMNGLAGAITLRQGDRYAPLGDDRYDLIAMNAPFVLGAPEPLVFRDGGLRGDDFAASLVRGAAAHLAPGGSLRMTLSWHCGAAGDPWARLRAWVPPGCDAFVLTRLDQSADAYVEGWLAESGAVQQPDYAARRAVWRAALSDLGADRIRTGVLVVQRGGPPRGGAPAPGAAPVRGASPAPEPSPVPDVFLALDPVDGIDAGLGAAVDGLLATVRRLATLDDAALQERRVVPVEGLRYTQTWERAAGGWTAPRCVLETSRGLHARSQVEPLLATLLTACDGSRPLGEVLRATVATAGLQDTDGALTGLVCDHLRALARAGLWCFAPPTAGVDHDAVAMGPDC